MTLPNQTESSIHPGLGKLIVLLMAMGSGLFSSAIDAQVQALVSGRIRSNTLAPLPAAQVMVPELQIGTISDLDGYFQLQVPKVDSLRLEVSYIGYESQQLTIRPGELADSVLVITLIPTTLWFSPVVILGQASFEKLKLAEPSFRLMDRSDIAAVPSITGPDVFRALQAQPGVHSTSELSNQLYIRGGTPDQNLILYNGVPLYQPFHLFGLTSSVDAVGVDYVKYYSGGFSVQYGDRLSGVLEIVTKPGSDTLATRMDWNPFHLGGTVSGPLGPKLRWRFTGRRSWFDLLMRLIDSNLAYNLYDLEGKVSWLPSPRHLVTFNLFRSRDFYDRSSTTVEYNPMYEYDSDPAVARADSNRALRIDKNQIDWGNTLASMRWVGRHSERFTTEATLYLSQLHQEVDNVNAYVAHDSASQSTREWVNKINDEHRYVATSRSALATSDLQDIGMNLTGRLDQPVWGELAAGISLQSRALDYGWNSTEMELISPYINIFMDYPPDSLDYELQASTAAGFLEATFTRLPGWVLRGGLRVTRHSLYSDWIVMPRFNANWQFHPRWHLVASWGRFSQLLSSSAEYGFYSVASLLFPAEEGALPTASHTLAGVNYDNARSLAFSLMLYYKDYVDLLYITPEHETASGPGWSHGLEASLVYAPREDLQLQAAYTWSVVRKRQEGEVFYPNYDQRHKLNLTLQLPRVGRWEPSLAWAFNTGRPGNLATSPYYAGQVGWYWRDFSNYPADINPPLPWPFELRMPKNFLRYPTYHRLDLMLSRSRETRRGRRTFYVQVINLYARQNVIFYDDIVRERVYDPELNDERDTWKATSFNGFPLLPMAGLSYEF